MTILNYEICVWKLYEKESQNIMVYVAMYGQLELHPCTMKMYQQCNQANNEKVL